MRHALRLATVIQQLTLASDMVYFTHHFSKQRIIPEASTLTVNIIIGLLDKPRGAHGGMHQINCTCTDLMRKLSQSKPGGVGQGPNRT